MRRQLWLHRTGYITLNSKRIEHYIQTLSSHHSADIHHLAQLRATLRGKVRAMAESWRCKRCWKVLSGKHQHCPHCGGRWDRVQDTSFQPPERREQERPSSQGRGKSPHGRNVQWTVGQRHQQAASERGRSGSEGVRKRRPRGKKKQNEDLPQYAAPTLPPPWNQSGNLSKEASNASEVVEMTAAETAEMMTALRTAYSDPQDMPDHVKKMVDKYENKSTEQLRKEMHRTTDTISKARKLLHQLQDARSKHRKSWLTHLGNLAKTLEKQIESFETQQKDYQDRIQKSKREIQISRRNLQRLNAQAAETAIPEMTIEDDEQVEPPLQDAEEAELRQQLHKIMRHCFKTSAVKDTIDIESEDEEDLAMEGHTLKRPRSCEPGSGAAAS